MSPEPSPRLGAHRIVGEYSRPSLEVMLHQVLNEGRSLTDAIEEYKPDVDCLVHSPAI